MSVVRTKKSKSNPYVMLDTTALNDDRLSYRAKGLHTYLMSKPDGWQVYIEQLEKSSPREGRDAIRTALSELQHAGYLHREKVRGKKGQMAGWDTTIYETPTLAVQEMQTSLATETIGLTDTDQPTSDQPTSDQPTSDQPSSANPQLVSIEEKLVLIEESIEGSNPSVSSLEETSPQLTPTVLMAWYNAHTPELHPKVHTLSPARRKKAVEYLRLFPEPAFWQRVFTEISHSDFLLGRKPSHEHENFRGDFDWLLSKGKDGTENCVKVAEGKYRDRQAHAPPARMSDKGMRSMQAAQRVMEDLDNADRRQNGLLPTISGYGRLFQ